MKHGKTVDHDQVEHVYKIPWSHALIISHNLPSSPTQPSSQLTSPETPASGPTAVAKPSKSKGKAYEKKLISNPLGTDCTITPSLTTTGSFSCHLPQRPVNPKATPLLHLPHQAPKPVIRVPVTRYKRAILAWENITSDGGLQTHDAGDIVTLCRKGASCDFTHQEALLSKSAERF